MNKRWGSVIRVGLTSVILILTAAGIAMATGAVGTASGFEDDDGNLAPDPADLDFDWNSFAPTVWVGVAPFRTSSALVDGWQFTGIEDDQGTNSDTGFAGGTKQDHECATIKGAKAPNKDDLKRIYLSTKVVDGHTYLNLAWVRIPQNTTSASAHVAFEFNKGDIPCGPASDGLVERTAGDMLVLYDFEGGSAEPVIKLARWTETAGDACDVSNNSPPCWGVAQNLTALGFAEAKVNIGFSVTDLIGPVSPDTLNDSEFGEAGIDLTAAGVFAPGVCESFGTAFGVSRSSGNSGTAQMKDLVGPADFTLANCGTVIIHKVTDPAGDTTTVFNFTTDVTTTPATTTSPFSLKDGETNTIVNVNPGSGLTVIEGAPAPGYALTDIDCGDSTVPAGNISTNTTTGAVTFDIAASETLECTFTNTLQRGAILVTKTRKHAADGSGDQPHSGVSFTVDGVTRATDANGQVCFDGLLFGTYDVVETVPDGYAADGDTTKSVTVDNNASCDDETYVGETVSFSNTPLTNITVSVDSQVPGGTSSTIDCVLDDAGPGDDISLSLDDLLPGTYTCTIVIDP